MSKESFGMQSLKMWQNIFKKITKNVKIGPSAYGPVYQVYLSWYFESYLKGVRKGFCLTQEGGPVVNRDIFTVCFIEKKSNIVPRDRVKKILPFFNKNYKKITNNS